jgi:hypothetical protein
MRKAVGLSSSITSMCESFVQNRQQLTTSRIDKKKHEGALVPLIAECEALVTELKTRDESMQALKKMPAFADKKKEELKRDKADFTARKNAARAALNECKPKVKLNKMALKSTTTSLKSAKELCKKASDAMEKLQTTAKLPKAVKEIITRMYKAQAAVETNVGFEHSHPRIEMNLPNPSVFDQQWQELTQYAIFQNAAAELAEADAKDDEGVQPMEVDAVFRRAVYPRIFGMFDQSNARHEDKWFSFIDTLTRSEISKLLALPQALQHVGDTFICTRLEEFCKSQAPPDQPEHVDSDSDALSEGDIVVDE